MATRFRGQIRLFYAFRLLRVGPPLKRSNNREIVLRGSDVDKTVWALFSPERYSKIDKDGSLRLASRRMPNPSAFVGTTYLLQIFASGFLAILFLQSGIDKVVDRRGNLEWLKGHFAKSPLSRFVPVLLTAITFLEVVAGALSAIGCILVIMSRDSTVAFYGAVISGEIGRASC